MLHLHFQWSVCVFSSVFFWLIEIVSHSVIRRAKVMLLECECCEHNFFFAPSVFFRSSFLFLSLLLSYTIFFRTLPKLIFIRLFRSLSLLMFKPFLQCDNTCWTCERKGWTDWLGERNWVRRNLKEDWKENSAKGKNKHLIWEIKIELILILSFYT